MKTRLLIILFLLTCVHSFGQTSNDSTYVEEIPVGHARVMGIKIDGDLKNFVVELSKKGFTIEKNIKEEHQYMMYGKFLDRDCTVLINGTEITNTVCSVFFIFKNDGTKNIYKEYAKLKSIYSDKYKIVEVKENALEDSNTEMALRTESKSCYTHFEDESTFINLELVYDDLKYKVDLYLLYLDKNNLDLKNMEKDKKYKNDI